MSNQEPQNTNQSTEDVAVEKRRLFIKGAGAAVPVILTLTSPPVLGGVMCLSQQMSGNASGNPVSCVKGNTPTYWKNPLYKDSWPTGFSYGTGTSTTSCTSYTAGTLFNASIAFGTSAGDITPVPALALRNYLCLNVNSPQSIWAAALLNAVYFSSNVTGYYVLTKQQVLDMWHGTLAPPGYPNTSAGKQAFLISTWT